MKQSPEMQKLEAMLRSSAFAAGGFMGNDPRSVTEVIDADAAELARLDVTAAQLAARMQEVTDVAIAGLENWIRISTEREARTEEARGMIPCPWSDGHHRCKRVTWVRRIDSESIVQWSDLNIHLIGAHTFFEGRGSLFRLEPAELVAALF
jgi:hypothetical protein